ncbi:Ribosomal protein S21 domain-containing protein [Blumeria hordei DH14]|uniref:Ribosomal protein S21 domain-containing protein n=1 Tax=Blumeria graminis f. sp. hordei (strain DH14) TaxID=546991 RepID=N1JGR4_BLUG1|nr:Ribosomal protein S21 domain-containing protein [Blumeria hordei DH14]
MQLRTSAVGLVHFQSLSLNKLHIQWSAARWGQSVFNNSKKCLTKNAIRNISDTTPREIFRIPKTSATPKASESFTPTLPDTTANESSINKLENQRKTLRSSWVDTSSKMNSPSSKANSINLKGMINSWINVNNTPQSARPANSFQAGKIYASPNSDSWSSSDSVFVAADKQRQTENQANWDKMLPMSSSDLSNSPTSALLKSMGDVIKMKAARQPIDLSPSSGRCVIITEKTDVMTAFKQMEVSCNKNRIRREANAQRFHERPGLKRKRLKQQRWRQRFLTGFKAVVNRVQELKRQGW